MRQSNFRKILVANRGEIALRIIRAIGDLDKTSVVVHSEFDRDLPFVTEADEAYSLGAGELGETYLDTEKILDIAVSAQVDAIHPGYGFLSENAEFAEACKKRNVAFIGPSAEVISLMGHKSNAREKAKELGVPVLEGFVDDLDHLISLSSGLPYPVLVKPAAGGGGKGMRIVNSSDEFEREAHEAAREAKNYFGSADLYVEKYLKEPRHIEVQIFADHHGNFAHLFERECSLQRRYQKIIEEAPSVSISNEIREQITGVAMKLIEGIGYTNAGTVEFLLADDQQFYFLEMNTRIQVEHPVTEMITGRDMVKEQIAIAEGHPLSFSQEDVQIKGHAIEARIYAEIPERDFLPSTGRIETFEVPYHRNVRIDSGFRKGNLVEPYYDPMLAKIIVIGSHRDDARNLLIQNLKEVRITGLRTNRDFLIEMLRSDAFKENLLSTHYVDQQTKQLLDLNRSRRAAIDMDHLLSAAALIALRETKEKGLQDNSPWSHIGHWRILPKITLLANQEKFGIKYELVKGREKLKLHIRGKDYHVSLERNDGYNYWIRINQQILKVWGITDRSEILLDLNGHLFKLRRLDILDRRFIQSESKQALEASDKVTAPLNGRIVQISVKEGDSITSGDPLVVIESMKMENKIESSQTAIVKHIHVSVAEQVHTNQLLITLAPR